MPEALFNLLSEAFGRDSISHHLLKEVNGVNNCRFAVVGLALFVGFFIASCLGSAVSLCVFAVLITAAAAAHFIKRKGAVFLLTAAAASFLIFGIYKSVYIDPCADLYGETRSMTAAVLSVSDPNGDKVSMTVEGECDGLRLRYSLYTLDRGYERGDIVDVTAKFSAPVKTARFGTDYDYSRGIFLRAQPVSVYPREKRRGPDITDVLTDVSEYMRTQVKERLRGDERALLLAMFFGDKSFLGQEFSNDVTRSGLAHMTAVSGMHLSLIVGVFSSLLSALFGNSRRVLRALLIAALILAFMVFFGMGASVRRSGIMMLIYYGAMLFRRKGNTANSLGAAAALILLAEPCACRDAGLIMSVCGTAGAGIVSPAFCRFAEKHIRLGRVKRFVAESFCTSYCTLPASALIFGNFSLASPISSVLVYPFFYGAMICALAGLLLPVMFVPAGVMLAPVAAYIRFVSGIRYVSLSFDGIDAVPFFALSAVFIASVAVLARKKRVRTAAVPAAAVVCGCALAGITAFGRSASADITEIRVYSDGSDCIAAVCAESGVSLFATDVTAGIGDAARELLNARCTDRYDLVCVGAPDKHLEMWSEAALSLETTELRYLSENSAEYDIGGEYSVRAYGRSVSMRINGVSVVIADVTDAASLGAHDIAVYGGCRQSPVIPDNTFTVFCDKRYPPENNAYYEKLVIKISRDGRVLMNGS